MRTTLKINDELLARAKDRAGKSGKSLGSYVDDALREYLSQPETASEPIELPVSRGGRLRRGIDPSSNRDLYELLDESGEERA